MQDQTLQQQKQELPPEGQSKTDDKRIIGEMTLEIEKLEFMLLNYHEENQKLSESNINQEMFYKSQLENASQTINNQRGALHEKTKQLKSERMKFQPQSLELINYQATTAAEIKEEDSDEEVQSDRFLLMEKRYKLELDMKEKLIQTLQQEKGQNENFLVVQSQIKQLSDLLDQKDELLNKQIKRVGLLQIENGYYKSKIREYEHQQSKPTAQYTEQSGKDPIWQDIFQPSQTSIFGGQVSQNLEQQRVDYPTTDVEQRTHAMASHKSQLEQVQQEPRAQRSEKRHITTVDRVISLIRQLITDPKYRYIQERNKVILAVLQEYCGFYKQFEQLYAQQNEPKWTQILNFVENLFKTLQYSPYQKTVRRIQLYQSSALPVLTVYQPFEPRKTTKLRTFSPPMIQKSFSPNLARRGGASNLSQIKRDQTQSFIKSLGSDYPIIRPNVVTGSRFAAPIVSTFAPPKPSSETIPLRASYSPFIPSSFNQLVKLLQTLQEQLQISFSRSVINQQISILERLLQMKQEQVGSFHIQFKPKVQNVTITPVYVDGNHQPTSTQQSGDPNAHLIQKLDRLSTQIYLLQPQLENLQFNHQDSNIIKDMKQSIEQLRIDYTRMLKLEQQNDDYIKEINRLNFEIERQNQTILLRKQQNSRMMSNTEQLHQLSAQNVQLQKRLEDQQYQHLAAQNKHIDDMRLLNDQINYLVGQIENQKNEKQIMSTIKEERDKYARHNVSLQQELQKTRSSQTDLYQLEVNKWVHQVHELQVKVSQQQKTIQQLESKRQPEIEQLQQTILNLEQTILRNGNKHEKQTQSQQVEIMRITSLYHDLVDQLHIRNGEHHKQLQHLQLENRTQQAKLVDYEKLFVNLKLKIDDQTTQLSEFEKLNLQLRLKHNDLQSADFKLLKEQKDQSFRENQLLRQKIQSLSSINERLNHQVQNLEIDSQTVTQLSAIRIQLEKQWENAKKEIDMQRKEINRQKLQIESSRREGYNTKRDLDDWRAKYSKLEIHIKDQDKQLTNLSREKSQHVAAIKNLEYNINVMRSDNKSMEKDITSLKLAKNQIDNDLEFQKQSASDMEKKYRVEIQGKNYLMNQMENQLLKFKAEVMKYGQVVMEKDQRIHELVIQLEQAQNSEKLVMNKNLANLQRLRRDAENERTQQEENLRQLKDIIENQKQLIDEVNLQKDQALKTGEKKLETISKDLEHNYQNIFESQVSQQKEQKVNYEKRISELERELDSLQHQISDNRQQYLIQQQTNKQIVDERDKAIQDGQAQRDSLHQLIIIDIEKQAILTIENQQRSFDYEQAKLHEKISNLVQDNETLSQYLTELKQEKIQTQKELLDLEEKLRSSQMMESESNQKTQYDLQKQLESERQSHEDEIRHLCLDKDKLLGRIKDLNQQLLQQSTMQSLDSQLISQQEIFQKDKQKLIDQFDQRVKSLTQELGNMKQQAFQHTTNLQALEKQSNQQLLGQKNNFQQEKQKLIDQYEQREKDLYSEINNLKQEISSQQKNLLSIQQQSDKDLSRQQEIYQQEKQSLIDQIDQQEKTSRLKIESLQHSQSQSIQQDDVNLNKINQELKDECDLLKKDVSRLSRALEEQLRAEISADGQIKAHDAKLKVQESLIAKLNKEIDMLNRRLAEELGRMNYWHDQATQSSSQVRIERDKIIKEQDTKRVQELEFQLEHLSDEKSFLETQLFDCRRQIDDLMGKFNPLDETNLSMQSSKELQSLRENLSHAFQDINTLQTDLTHRQQELDFLYKELNDQQNQHEITFRQYQQLHQSEVRSLNDTINKIRSDMSQHKSEHDQQTDMLRYSSSEIRPRSVLTEVKVTRESFHNGQYSVSQEKYQKEEQPVDVPFNFSDISPTRDKQIREIDFQQETVRYENQLKFYRKQVDQLRDQVSELESEVKRLSQLQNTHVSPVYMELEQCKKDLKLSQDLDQVKFWKQKSEQYEKDVAFLKSELQNKTRDFQRFYNYPTESGVQGQSSYDTLYQDHERLQKIFQDTQNALHQLQEKVASQDSQINTMNIQKDQLRVEIAQLRTQNKLMGPRSYENVDFKLQYPDVINLCQRLEVQVQEWKDRYEQSQKNCNMVNNELQTLKIFHSESSADYGTQDQLIEDIHQLRCLNQDLKLKIKTLEDDNMSLGRPHYQQGQEFEAQHHNQIQYLKNQLHQAEEQLKLYEAEIQLLRQATKEVGHQPQEQCEIEIMDLDEIQSLLQELQDRTDNLNVDQQLQKIRILYDTQSLQLREKIQELQSQIKNEINQRKQTEQLYHVLKKQTEYLKDSNQQFHHKVTMLEIQNLSSEEINLKLNYEIEHLKESLASCQLQLDENQVQHKNLMETLQQQTNRSQFE